jgi:hypothetical protein
MGASFAKTRPVGATAAFVVFMLATAVYCQGVPARFHVAVALAQPVRCATAATGPAVTCERAPQPSTATGERGEAESVPIVLSYRLFDGVPVGVVPAARKKAPSIPRDYLPPIWSVRSVGDGDRRYLEFCLTW